MGAGHLSRCATSQHATVTFVTTQKTAFAMIERSMDTEKKKDTYLNSRRNHYPELRKPDDDFPSEKGG
jgi:hypothetical protein